MTFAPHSFRGIGVIALIPVSLALLAGCARPHPATAPEASSSPELSFATPEEAVKALETATAAHDKAAMRKLFGPDLDRLTSGDPVQDANDFSAFAKSLSEKVDLKQADGKIALTLGKQEYPFPIPLVQTDGRWFFDTRAGWDEVLKRRIGEDELNAIKICRAYVQAQREYFTHDWNSDGIIEYARRFVSTPGQKDGLFWETAANETPSPLGPLVAEARAEGYHKKEGAAQHKRAPYHGYYFKILTRQGGNAPGGRYNYVINGHMVAGFALVAWPAQHGYSGVMTFLVNQNGQVYQKDLGASTASVGERMTAYNPDKTWEALKD